MFRRPPSITIGVEGKDGKITKVTDEGQLVGVTLLRKHWEELRDAVDEYFSEADGEALLAEHRQDVAELMRYLNMATLPTESSAKRREPDRSGFIYLLHAEGYYKIGRTNNVDRRVTQLSTKMPFEPELVHSFATDDMFEAERDLHERFADKRVNGEWFELDKEDVAWLKAMGESNDR